MTYRGRVQDGVIVLEGNAHLEEGTVVRIIEEKPEKVGEALDRLAGAAQELPEDLAQRHDDYRRARP